MSGILHCEEEDNLTAYSYFLEVRTHTHINAHIQCAFMLSRDINLLLTSIDDVRTGVRSVRSVQRQEGCSVFEVHDAVQGAYVV